jgi:hypothetical protein
MKKILLSLFVLSFISVEAAADRTSDLTKFENENVIICIPPIDLKEGDTYACEEGGSFSTVGKNNFSSGSGALLINIVEKENSIGKNYDWDKNVKDVYEKNITEIKNDISNKLHSIYLEDKDINKEVDKTLQNTFSKFYRNIRPQMVKTII